MKRKFLGDSYDMAKRFWADLLRKTAPLYADPVFFKDDKDKGCALQREFTRLTGIQMEVGRTSGVFSILLDPDTGISLTDKPSPRHVTTEYIAKRLRESGAKYVVAYDQSFGRGEPKEVARQRKMTRMRKHGYPSFYYVSHASFLFAAKSQQGLRELRTIIEKAGVPACKLEELRTARGTSHIPERCQGAA